MNRRQFIISAGTFGLTGLGCGREVRAALAHPFSAAVSKPSFWRLAPLPPMGWNSYDNYGGSVDEVEFLRNADVMQRQLAQHGYEYMVLDYGWFNRFVGKGQKKRPVMDRFGRHLPAANRFASAAGREGFKPLADKLHAMGLKFGFHLMRGIPRAAVAANLPIANSKYTAREAADMQSTCAWNSDMYGVKGDTPAGQAYYDSVIRLYASWNTDFIKWDDLTNPYHGDEIRAIRRSLDRFGPRIVLSTSPGHTPVARAAEIERCANMWRIRNDFWDRWPELDDMIDRVAMWKGFAGPGHWPDCDMICLGHIGTESVGGTRMTHLTMDEQRLMMTLWALAPSPLFLGMDLTKMDPWTLSLIANQEVLAVNQDPLGAQGIRIDRQGPLELWAKKLHNGDLAMALFNRGTINGAKITAHWAGMGMPGRAVVRDVWNHRTLGAFAGQVHLPVAGHGARLLRIIPA